MNIGIGMSIVGASYKAPDAVGGVDVFAQRFYFSAITTPDIEVDADGGWGDTGNRHIAKLTTAKEAGDSITAVSANSLFAMPALLVQAISDPLIAQTIAGTVKCQMQARDGDQFGDVVARLAIRIVTSTGLVRGTLLSIGDYSTGSVWANVMRNKKFVDGDAVSSVDAQDGDYLVVELGYNSDQFSSSRVWIGDPSGTTDLPENETTTSGLVPWIQFVVP